MTDITELAPAMKAAAEKASGGDWVKESGDGWDATCSNDDQANSGFIIAHFVGPDSADNREFVQLANPANILALVEALEKSQHRIAELEEAEQKLCAANVTLDARAELAERQLAELESLSVTVKLPQRHSMLLRVDFNDDYHTEMAFKADEVQASLAAAGIKVEAE